MTVTEVSIGMTVRFRRGGYWQTGVVTYIGRSVAHIKAGDDFLGYQTYVEDLKILQSTDHANVANEEQTNDDE